MPPRFVPQTRTPAAAPKGFLQGPHAPGAVRELISIVTGGTATVTTAIVRTRAVSASITATSSVAASVVRVRARSASISAVSSVTASDVRTRARTASITASSTVTAAVVRVRARTASSMGAASVSTSVQRTRAEAAAITSVSTVAAALVRTRAFAATALGQASIAAAITGTTPAIIPSGGGDFGIVYSHPPTLPVIERDVPITVSSIHAGATVRAALTVIPAPALDLDAEFAALLGDVLVLCEA